MKKLFLILFLFSVFFAEAQNMQNVGELHKSNTFYNKDQFEVRVGVGLEFDVEIFSFDKDRSFDYPTYCGDDIYAPYPITVYAGYKLEKWLILGFSLTYMNKYQNYYEVMLQEKVGKWEERKFVALTELRFVWLNKEYITMYSSIGLGFKYEKSKENNRLENYSYNNNWSYNMAGDIAPIGITAGKSLYGYCELGFGAHGVLRAGIGYRF